MSGTSASPENGISEGLPSARKSPPSTTTRIAGRIEPAIVPIEPIRLDARTPARFAIVVPQKNTIIVTTRNTLFVASAGSIA